MWWLNFWIIILSCSGRGLSQETVCDTDFLVAECPKIIRSETAMACYEQNVRKVCCKTCDKFKDPLALDECKYGDKSFFCSKQNCTVPPNAETRICCKTCRSSLETELASSTTQSTTQGISMETGQTTGVTTASNTQSTPGTTTTPGIAAQKPEMTTGKVATNPETITTKTTSSNAPSSATSSILGTTTTPGNAAAQKPEMTTEKAATKPETLATKTTSSNSPSISTSSILKMPTATTTAQSTEMTTSQTITTTMTTKVATDSPSRTPTIQTRTAVNPVKPCRDYTRRCRTIHQHQCYTKYITDRCCASCSKIAESKPKDCPYGDRLPLWCLVQVLRSPKVICRSHDDLCCESCKHVDTSRVVFVRPPMSHRERSRRRRIKGRKSKRRRKGRKDRRRWRIRD